MKADADRDLYADLELPATADANEIKRQFKKLALKYHPDRNPGKEVEFNAKFQAIQSANEVLTDPQQRAKYDAQRIRAGLLHTYNNATSPPNTKPTVPPRPFTSTYAQQARPAPTSATKSNFPPPPPPPGSARAERFARNARVNGPDSAFMWEGRGTDDAKAKTNDYKAWAQMKHGEGPLPGKRTAPPKAARSSTFQSGREAHNGIPKHTTPGRSNWDRFPDAGMPGMTRSNTTRVSQSPKRSGFAPGTPGGDEQQAPSAYFNVSRGDRPNSSKAQTYMPPPPTPVPTARKPDPLQQFRDKVTLNDRLSTPYKKAGGEKTYFASPGLHRSATTATPRETDSRTGLYETPHARAAAAASSIHNGKSSSEKKESRLRHMASETSSSSSSSDDDVQAFTSAKSSATEAPKTRRGRMPAGMRRQTGFNPFAKGKDAGDEPMAPQAGLGDGYYRGTRRHSAIDLDSEKTSGFEEHRAQHEAERSRQQSHGAFTSVPGTQSSDGSQPSLARSKSWQEKWEGHKAKWGSPPHDKGLFPATQDQNNKTPMYAQRGFKIPDYTERSFAGTSHLRSRSSEPIDTKFSPDGYQPKFFEPSRTSRSATPLHTESPSRDNTASHRQRGAGNGNNMGNYLSKTSSRNIPPPPPPPQGEYSPERWAPHLAELDFNMEHPLQGRSSSRPANRKRPRTQAPMTSNIQPTVNDAEDEPTANIVTGESRDSSMANSDVDAMDLDEPTPAHSSATTSGYQTNGNPVSPKQPDSISNTPRQRPSSPPSSTDHVQSEPDATHLNLNEFKNTFPFAPSNEGLTNMKDLATDLPFESHASASQPTANTPSLRYGLPNPPRFPTTPRNMTPRSCEDYLKQLRRYVNAWNSFNTDMVQLLGKRQAFIQESSNCNWLDIRGTGYDDYMHGLEEHKRARVHLETAYDHHEKSMKDLGFMRDEMKRGRGEDGRRPSVGGDRLRELFS